MTCTALWLSSSLETKMAMGQHQWQHFGPGAPPILVHFSKDWDFHWGYDLGFDLMGVAQNQTGGVTQVLVHVST